MAISVIKQMDSNPFEERGFVEKMVDESRFFFKTYGSGTLLGKEIGPVLEQDASLNPFENLLTACGYEQDASGFFNALYFLIKNRSDTVINGIKIPLLYLYHLLDILIQSKRIVPIQTVDQLELNSFVIIEKKDAKALQQVIDTYPVRLSSHVIRQAMVSDKVFAQYFPFKEEIDPKGHVITFEGHIKNGLLEQMYENRVVFLLDMNCPVYCRFCFRKHKSIRNEKSPSRHDVEAAIGYVSTSPQVKEILITGGEPLINRSNIETVLDGLVAIEHVRTIRIATRTIFYHPDFFLKNGGRLIQFLEQKNKTCHEYGKQLEIGVHIVHPDELSVKSLNIIKRLVSCGINIYVQTPFLKDLNDDGFVLGRLFMQLRNAGVKIYYIFTPCSPIHGTQKYWTSIDQALEAYKTLRAHFSDRCIPKLCTATPLGKIEWHTSGWAVEKDHENKDYLWIRTPYTREYFKGFMEDNDQLPQFRINQEGTLDVRFLAAVNDTTLFKGSRNSVKNRSTQRLPQDLYSNFTHPNFPATAFSKPGFDDFSRIHRTRVEMMLNTSDAAFDYLTVNEEITDVVLVCNGLQILAVEKLGNIIDRIKKVPNITCVRLRSDEFISMPGAFNEKIIEKLSQLNGMTLARPFRLEIEAWFLHPDQVTIAHKDLVYKLSISSISVYANTVLLSQVNDDPSTILALAHALRDAGIEFHHVYVAGLEIQDKWTPTTDIIIDIASMVRQQCSGREIPLYVTQTSSGEKDFGLTRQDFFKV
jgi:lysine 2,3-aminomutase